MGSPVSVSVANIVMEDVEERALAPMRFSFLFGRDTLMTSVLLFLSRESNTCCNTSMGSREVSSSLWS